jgi:hypothetical protein
MKNTDAAVEKEFADWCALVGIEFTQEQLETLRKCRNYQARLLESGVTITAIGVRPDISVVKNTKPAQKTVIDYKKIYESRNQLGRKNHGDTRQGS